MTEEIIRLLTEGNVREAERYVARMVLELSEGVASGTVIPLAADAYVSRLWIRIGEQFPHVKLDENVEQLMIEGMSFHDYGTKFGPDFGLIRAYAKQVLA
ncbi:MAG: hypothetical protein NZT92_06965 [Abditibacteriales bacterium]|nr:hypothetical protein [Abditibacteriales bacterium]MDW8364741.1 hypothetical protein [Abditibacteriales bacterium]